MGLIEALSYGIPTLVTEGTNMKLEIEESNAGWTATNDYGSIKLAFMNMLSDMNSFEIKGQNAYELSKSYDWERIAQISSRKYQDLITK